MPRPGSTYRKTARRAVTQPEPRNWRGLTREPVTEEHVLRTLGFDATDTVREENRHAVFAECFGSEPKGALRYPPETSDEIIARCNYWVNVEVKRDDETRY